jgi:hypothetical protein
VSLPLFSREASYLTQVSWLLVFGPVFRMQSDLLTDPIKPRVGEWIYLQHSNDLLSQWKLDADDGFLIELRDASLQTKGLETGIDPTSRIQLKH